MAELPPFSPLTWKEQAATLGVAIWLFIGMEFVTPLAEEIKNPGRNISLAMLFGCFTIWFVDLLFGLGVTKYIELDKLAASTIPHVEGAQAAWKTRTYYHGNGIDSSGRCYMRYVFGRCAENVIWIIERRNASEIFLLSSFNNTYAVVWYIFRRSTHSCCNCVRFY